MNKKCYECGTTEKVFSTKSIPFPPHKAPGHIRLKEFIDVCPKCLVDLGTKYEELYEQFRKEFIDQKDKNRDKEAKKKDFFESFVERSASCGGY